MSADLHPYWKSTDLRQGSGRQASVGGSASDDRTEKLLKRISAPKRRVRVKRKGGAMHPFMITILGASTVGVLGLVFMQGVNFLQADLMQELEKDSDAGISNSVDVSATDLVAAPVTSPIPVLKLTPTPIPAPTSTPAPTPTSMQAPTLDLGQSALPSTSSAWPSALRINRYTVGSSFVPAFSPTAQIPVDDIRKVQQQVHSAAQRALPQPKAQPKTGPGLWIVWFVSLGALSFLGRRRKEV